MVITYPEESVTRQTLPDARFIDFAYDANGNLTSLTPPGRSPHVFPSAVSRIRERAACETRRLIL